ncbi:primosomal protein N' [candidate division KSB1 bacterium]|nr:primosomal protein N' [candidate division KSB1 bacterium]
MQNTELQQPYANVVFPVPVEHAFTYRVPGHFDEDVVPGVRVLCPFGRRKATGFVVSRSATTDVEKLRDIEQVLDPVPLFTPQVLELARWLADYYLCGWGEVLKAALPAGINIDSERVVRLLHPSPQELVKSMEHAPRQADIVLRVAAENPLRMSKLIRAMGKNIYGPLKQLRDKRYVRIELELPDARVRPRYETVVCLSEKYSYDDVGRLIHELQTPAPKQAAVLSLLLSSVGSIVTRPEVCLFTGAKNAVINTLAEREYIRLEKREVIRDYYGDVPIEPPTKLVLNPDQVRALATIKQSLDSGHSDTLLLHGVTGSGKTQVYIEAIYHVLAKGRSAIVLVPEIVLTPQAVRRFRAHFGAQVAVFHSRMSPGERYDSWRQTWEGKHRIVIGPRSAIFSPLKNIGLIIVDEEHEHSYKQSDLTPRYNGRDIAVVRGHTEKAVVVLGSATPAIESYFNARIDKYKFISMPSRIDDIPMPTVEIVDMKREPRIIGRVDPIIFSRRLRVKIDEKLSKGEQIILFLNRRGFATMFKCHSCGYLAKCEHCDISLTFHLRGRLLKCHYCGYTRRAPDVCPDCSGRDVMLRGIGTQRVEEELKLLFPGVKAVRMDMDTTKGRMAHDRVLSKFGSGEYSILLGTQMVAKGLDFPNVTLVGVINADTELLLPDFRSAERTFQLLTQVAGRAGRKDKLGEVIIQTFTPDHYSLQFAKKHDYESFFKAELFDRKGLLYPPYSRLINILLRGPDEKRVQEVAMQLAQLIPQSTSHRMLGPTQARVGKIQNHYRWQILLMSDKQNDAGGKEMKNALRSALEKFKEKYRATKVQIVVDVDPMSVL